MSVLSIDLVPVIFEPDSNSRNFSLESIISSRSLAPSNKAFLVKLICSVAAFTFFSNIRSSAILSNSDASILNVFPSGFVATAYNLPSSSIIDPLYPLTPPKAITIDLDCSSLPFSSSV